MFVSVKRKPNFVIEEYLQYRNICSIVVADRNISQSEI